MTEIEYPKWKSEYKDRYIFQGFVAEPPVRDVRAISLQSPKHVDSVISSSYENELKSYNPYLTEYRKSYTNPFPPKSYSKTVIQPPNEPETPDNDLPENQFEEVSPPPSLQSISERSDDSSPQSSLKSMETRVSTQEEIHSNLTKQHNGPIEEHLNPRKKWIELISENVEAQDDPRHYAQTGIKRKPRLKYIDPIEEGYAKNAETKRSEAEKQKLRKSQKRGQSASNPRRSSTKRYYLKNQRSGKLDSDPRRKSKNQGRSSKRCWPTRNYDHIWTDESLPVVWRAAVDKEPYPNSEMHAGHTVNSSIIGYRKLHRDDSLPRFFERKEPIHENLSTTYRDHFVDHTHYLRDLYRQDFGDE